MQYLHEAICSRPRLLGGRRARVEAPRVLTHVRCHALLEERQEEILLAPEVGVQGPCRSAGLTRDLLDRSAVKPTAGETASAASSSQRRVRALCSSRSEDGVEMSA